LAWRLGNQELTNKIAYLGLGIMGGSMAANLVRAGGSVRGWNRTAGRPTVEQAAANGVRLVGTAREAVQDADFVFLCLTNAQDIEHLLLGATADAPGLLPDLKAGAIVVDMSTTGPQCARLLHKELAAHKLRFLDAPVSGGDIGARDGTLTIMVGGEEKDFNECRPWFEAMGKKIFYCGTAGSGQAVKLCNQVLCAVNLVAVCEALQLAQAQGIDPALVVDICQTGAAGSWALSNLGPRILKDDLKPAFKIKDMLKDLNLVRTAAPAGDDLLCGTLLADRKLTVARDLGGTSGGDQGTQAMIRAYRGK
jgi:3-hydroxyisobutyrate dehydrogenase